MWQRDETRGFPARGPRPAGRAGQVASPVGREGRDTRKVTTLLASQLTGSSLWDGTASVVIGLLLLWVALHLIRANASPLIGQAAPGRLTERIREEIAALPEVESVVELLTMMPGPGEIWSPPASTPSTTPRGRGWKRPPTGWNACSRNGSPRWRRSSSTPPPDAHPARPELSIHLSTSSGWRGSPADMRRAPSAVTTRSSSMRTPMPRSSGGSVRSSGCR